MTGRRGISSIVLGRREAVIPTEAEDHRYLHHNWGSVYIIIRPGTHDEVWRAIAKFGNEDELIADSADELLDLIRHHYGPETPGYMDMLSRKLGIKFS